MIRSDIINFLIKKYKLKTYLEIGIGDGGNFKKIECENKVSVDPFFDNFNGQNEENPPTFRMTSDEFFKSNTEKFDLIFVDGLHTYEQTLIDIQNSLIFLNDGGFVLAHDTLPLNFYNTRLEYNGECWKSIVYFRCSDSTVSIKTVDTDHGVTVIKKEPSELYIQNFETVNFDSYLSDKVNLMNLIKINQIDIL